MDKKNIIALFFIFAAMLVSGCTLPTGFNPFNSSTPPQTGVLVEDFSPDFQSVHSGEEVKFLLRVKNTGSVKAENGFAELLGIDQVWTKGKGAEEISGEVLPDETMCKYTNQGRKISLLPEDPEAGTTGEEAICTWRYVAPFVPSGLNVHSTPRARFYYSYSSSTIKTITIASRDELKTLEEQGKPLPSESYSKTKSPISIDIETSTPIRTYGNNVEFPIVIIIKNVGGGTVCRGDSNACKKPGGTGENDAWNNFDIKINLPAGLTLSPDSCQQNGQGFLTINQNSNNPSVVLVGNSPQTISCRITAALNQQIGVAQKNIEARANYGYFIDKTTDVYVYPSSEPLSGAQTKK